MLHLFLFHLGDVDDCVGATACVLDMCFVEPCLNGATCIDGINSYTCECASGYFGTYCFSSNNIFYVFKNGTKCHSL